MALKKKSVFIVACLLLLTACTSNNQVSSNNVVAKAHEESIYADDLYNELLDSAKGKELVFQKIFLELVNGNFPVTNAMKTDADLQIQQLKENYSAYYGGDGEAYLLSALEQQGYNSIEEYRDIIVYTFQLSEFLEVYINENFDEIFEDYYKMKSPRYVSHILVQMEDSSNPSEEELAKVKEIEGLLAEGKPFADIAVSHSEDGSAANGGALGFTDADTNFVPEFLEVSLALKEGEISDYVISQFGYHFIKVDSTNKEELKSDINVTAVGSGRLYTYDPYLSYLAFASYELNFSDERIQMIVDEIIDSIITARENARNGGN